MLFLCVQNVQDQLNLWQAETQRVQTQEITYYSKFEDDDLFRATYNAAKGYDTVLSFKHEPTNPEASYIVIRRSGKAVENAAWQRCRGRLGSLHEKHPVRTLKPPPAVHSRVSQRPNTA